MEYRSFVMPKPPVSLMVVVADTVAPTSAALLIDTGPTDERVAAVRLAPARVIAPLTATPPVTTRLPPEMVKFSLDVMLLTVVAPELYVIVRLGPVAPRSGMTTSSPAAGSRPRSQLLATFQSPPAAFVQLM